MDSDAGSSAKERHGGQVLVRAQRRDYKRNCSSKSQWGINWCDTAEVYGWGASEAALASALASLGKDVPIATKWWPALRTARSISHVVEEQLQRLKHIDIYQVHQPFGFSSVEKEMDAMAKLVEKKKIRYIGVSNFSAKKMRRADVRLRVHGLRLISNQVL